MKKSYVSRSLGLIGTMMRGLRNLFSWGSPKFDGGNTDPFKKKIRTINHGRRSFKYVGTDGNHHRVRVGNAFPVRPLHAFRFFIATHENRQLLQVK